MRTQNEALKHMSAVDLARMTEGPSSRSTKEIAASIVESSSGVQAVPRLNVPESDKVFLSLNIPGFVQSPAIEVSKHELMADIISIAQGIYAATFRTGNAGMLMLRSTLTFKYNHVQDSGKQLWELNQGRRIKLVFGF